MEKLCASIELLTVVVVVLLTHNVRETKELHDGRACTIGVLLEHNIRETNGELHVRVVAVVVVVVVAAVVVFTLTHRHNTMQSVVAGQVSITLEWKKYLRSKKKQSSKKYVYDRCATPSSQRQGEHVVIARRSARII